MEREYQALPLRDLGTNAGIRRPAQAQPGRVTLESPALEVMTDLTRVDPATIRAQAPLSGANQFMITRGVRLLLVTDEEHETVLGLITATDIVGERPQTVATSRGVPLEELTVADIMTPAAQVQVVAFGYAQGACVGHVLASMRKTGRQHALVVDYDELPPPRPSAPPAKRAMVRGIFSVSQIAAQLGGSFPQVETTLGE